MSAESWVVAGLGNPGPRYAKTRHNVGQMVVDVLAARIGGKFSQHRAGAQVLEGRLLPGGTKVILLKSTGYMNTSGGPVSGVAKYFGVGPENLIVVHDELDIPFDTLRLKKGGGHGGHNGIRDIAKALGTPDFLRVRVGIGRPPGQQEVADFVLSPFSSAEQKNLPVLLADAADAVEKLQSDGLLAAQQVFHGGVK